MARRNGDFKVERYATRDAEAGNQIEAFETLDEAVDAISRYEVEDRNDGCYEPDFYEIYDLLNEEVVC